jgi:hypothetical protein
MREIKLALAAFLALFIVLFTTAIVSASNATTTISSVISPIISLFTTSGTVHLDIAPSGTGLQTIASDTVTVSTNDSGGYTLTLADTDATNTMVSGSNTIPASAGTQTTPVAQVVNTWGYAVAGVGGFNSTGYAAGSNQAINGTQKFAGVPVSGSPNTLKTTSGTAADDTTTVWYAIAVNTTQPTGIYTDGVTYTATTN